MKEGIQFDWVYDISRLNKKYIYCKILVQKNVDNDNTFFIKFFRFLKNSHSLDYYYYNQVLKYFE